MISMHPPRTAAPNARLLRDANLAAAKAEGLPLTADLDELVPQLAQALLAKRTEDWLALFEDAGVPAARVVEDLSCLPVNALASRSIEGSQAQGPMSDQTSMLPRSSMVGRNCTTGPARKPARM